MSPRSRHAQALTGLIVILSLVLPTFTPPQVQGSAVVEEIEPFPLSEHPPMDGLFRARITFPNPPARAHLTRLEVVVLTEGDDEAVVLVDGEQLEALARLRFEPQAVNDLSLLVQANAHASPWLAESLEPLLAQAAIVQQLSYTSDSVRSTAVSGLRTMMQTLSPEELAGIRFLSSVDDDADGLTNTQEQWWCTDPLNPDSDGDGVSDGEEVADLKSWIGNELPGPPSYGKPFVGWPPDHVGCYDDDQDSVPDLAERWELGLNMNRESTDRDKFDDGQELFGNTYCPGSGGYCGYGALPRNEDWGIIFAEMPSWVEAPGDHPFVAAFPVPEIDVVESSLHVETVTVVTTDHTISEGEERSYSTARTEGTSTSVANTETWNEWQESIEITEEPAFYRYTDSSYYDPLGLSFLSDKTWMLRQEIESDCTTRTSFTGQSNTLGFEVGGPIKVINLSGQYEHEWSSGEETSKASVYSDTRCQAAIAAYCEAVNDNDDRWCRYSPLDIRLAPNTTITTQIADMSALLGALEGVQFAHTASGQLIGRRLYGIEYALTAPRRSTSEVRGSSQGGSYTTTNERYEEHTVTNSEAFSTEESWGIATAQDSSHAAELWFTYHVRNTGTEYAREICDLVFNIYIGSGVNPAYTYFVGPDVGGDGCFNNFMPQEGHEFTSRRIPLTLEQMKAIDLGEPIRIVVEDYTYGIDELFYSDAINAGSLIAIEDGTDDGDESIDTYLIPTWDTEKILDVLTRYFPYSTDIHGSVIAIWTPEYTTDTPSWCVDPLVVGTGGQRTLWCKHALSTTEWWLIYTNGLGDNVEGFQESIALAGGAALFRFNKDTDLDGYSDRSEVQLGTDPHDPDSLPAPELLGGIHSTPNGSQVTATLSLLNTGLYDAYGVESVMIAPNDSISITSNAIGGSGRVRALNSVVVGSWYVSMTLTQL